MKTVLFLIISFCLFSCISKGGMAGGKAICLDSIVIQKELRFSSLFEKPEIMLSTYLIEAENLSIISEVRGVVRESIRCCVILRLIRKGMSMP